MVTLRKNAYSCCRAPVSQAVLPVAADLCCAWITALAPTVGIRSARLYCRLWIKSNREFCAGSVTAFELLLSPLLCSSASAVHEVVGWYLAWLAERPWCQQERYMLSVWVKCHCFTHSVLEELPSIWRSDYCWKRCLSCGYLVLLRCHFRYDGRCVFVVQTHNAHRIVAFVGLHTLLYMTFHNIVWSSSHLDKKQWKMKNELKFGWFVSRNFSHFSTLQTMVCINSLELNFISMSYFQLWRRRNVM